VYFFPGTLWHFGAFDWVVRVGLTDCLARYALTDGGLDHFVHSGKPNLFTDKGFGFAEAKVSGVSNVDCALLE
jgi:hypothetical protein